MVAVTIADHSLYIGVCRQGTRPGQDSLKHLAIIARARGILVTVPSIFTVAGKSQFWISLQDVKDIIPVLFIHRIFQEANVFQLLESFFNCRVLVTQMRGQLESFA